MLALSHIERALTLKNFDTFAAQMGMLPAARGSMQPRPDQPPRKSAVLVLLYPDADNNLNLILTKRTDHLRGHSGQVSFPGGSCDDEDQSFEDTALRETCEEIGVCDRSKIQLLGRLTKMWIPPSNFDVVPVVACMASKPKMTLSPAEVAQVLILPLDKLVDDKTKKITQMEFRGTIWDVPYYDVEGQVVWGATAAMLSELETRLKIVLAS